MCDAMTMSHTALPFRRKPKSAPKPELPERKVFVKHEMGSKPLILVPDEEGSAKIREQLLKYPGIIVHEVGFNPTVSPVDKDPKLASFFVMKTIELVRNARKHMLSTEDDKSHLAKARNCLDMAYKALGSVECLIDFQLETIKSISTELYNMSIGGFINANRLAEIIEELRGINKAFAACDKNERYCIVVTSKIFPDIFVDKETHTECLVVYVVVEIPSKVLADNFGLYIRVNGNNVMVADNSDAPFDAAEDDPRLMADTVLSFFSLCFEETANVRHRQLLRIVE